MIRDIDLAMKKQAGQVVLMIMRLSKPQPPTRNQRDLDLIARACR